MNDGSNIVVCFFTFVFTSCGWMWCCLNPPHSEIGNNEYVILRNLRTNAPIYNLITDAYNYDGIVTYSEYNNIIASLKKHEKIQFDGEK